jgi:LacI family transcriptional regulator
MGQWLSGLPKPVGVFSFSDAMVVQLLAACYRVGLTVPEEVALLGCGNTNQCELAQIGLSSIDPNTMAGVRVALRLLRDLMAGKPAPPQPIMVPPEGVAVRTSTDVLAVPDLRVAKALRFIWEHYREDLSIQDIADFVGVPRRTLEYSFRAHLNRTVHAELTRKRVTELRRLLLGTKEPLADLAPRVGLYTLTNATRRFRDAYGMSPGKYRLEHGGAGGMRSKRSGRRE